MLQFIKTYFRNTNLANSNLTGSNIAKNFQSMFQKKIPIGDKYPYLVVNPFTALGENSGYESLYLIGDDWLENPDKPIAVVLGCNDWKYGFLADYLPEYRVAFGPRKLVGLNAISVFDSLNIKPEKVFIWGYTENITLSKYLQWKGYPVCRIEDAFIRSSDLGASHATPYSLVFDQSGLYYNSYEPSDVENILNTYDFSADNNLMTQAKEVLKTVVDLKTSKYNPPVIFRDKSIKIKKRVAILGQVDSDSSIRYGNPDNWTTEELIKLAYLENPDAELLFRPHPEIYKGYQKSKFKRKRVEHFAKIVNPDENIIDFIERVDHVYTITSLSGFEALIRGKLVTVAGVPFYAGWGLTDDRCKTNLDRRTRKLSLEDIFAGAYLLYPKYLASLNDPVLGAKAAIYRIQADQYVAMDSFAKKFIENYDENTLDILKSYKWPAILLNDTMLADEKRTGKILKTIRFNEFFEDEASHIYQLIVSYLIVGKLPTNSLREQFLTIIREYLSKDDLNQLLLDLERYLPGEYLTKQWAWLFAEVGEDELALNYIDKRIAKYQQIEVDNPTNVIYISDKSQCAEEKKTAFDHFNADACASALNVLEIQIADRRIEKGVKTAKFLLLANYETNVILKHCITISELMFDFRSTQKISRFLQGISLDYSNRFGLLAEFRCSQFNIIENKQEYFKLLSLLLSQRADKIDSVKFNLAFFPQFITAIDEDFDILKAQLSLDNDLSIKKSQAYVALEEFMKAEKVIKNILANGEENESVLIQLSQVLSYNGKLEEAIALMKFARSNGLTNVNVRESLRLFVLGARYHDSLTLLNSAIKQRIPIGEMHKRKCYFGNRMLKEAFETFTEIALCKNVATYYKEKYYRFEYPLLGKEKVFLLAIFGPGDEIRFASTYNMIKNILGTETNISIASSPRLVNLFSNSYPEIKFIPVARPRNSDKVDLENYTDVPGSDIMSVVDNTAISSINRADKILFVTDMLHRCLPDYGAFPGVSYLVADSERVAEFKLRLPQVKPLVGISWRSSLTTSARNEHYLSIEQLEPLFALDNVQFVNLQYDECRGEVAWVNECYPGKMIDFEDIDQYNDFDSVAALMKCMDLIIAPATTVVELAGALGCKTWLFSNSSEINWRKIDEQGTDVWHNSVTIVDVDDVGNKEALVDEIYRRLVQFSVTK